MYIEQFQYAGATTDSGGGGTGFSFCDEMKTLDLIDEDWYLVGFCCMHTTQLTFKNPAEKVLGMNGLESRSALQAVFQLFYLQDNTETKKWRKILEHIASEMSVQLKGVDGNKDAEFTMPAPVMTRWWTIGQAVRYIMCNLAIFKKLPLYFIYGSETKKISSAASDVFSLMKEKTVIADLTLIHAFCSNYLHPSFQWFQGGDDAIGGTPGFKGRLVLGRYFVMQSILEGWSNGGWKEDDGMKLYKEYIDKVTEICTVIDDEEAEDRGHEGGEETNEEQERRARKEFESVRGALEDGVLLEDMGERPLNRELQETKADEFFRLALVSLNKHFKIYGRELLVLSLFGDAPTAKILARFLLNKEPLLEESDEPSYESAYLSHKKGETSTIDLNEFASFVKEKVDLEFTIKDHHIQRLKSTGAIERIAGGLDIWSDDEGSDLKKFYQQKYAAFATTTHFVESGVKSGKDADNDSRSEKRMSHYGLACNARTEINAATKERMVREKGEKSESYKNGDSLEARGKAQSIETICYAMKKHEKIESLIENDDDREAYNEIVKRVTKESEAFENKRADDEFQEFLNLTARRQERNEGGMRATKSQRVTGYDTTPLIRQEVAFSDLKKVHLKYVRLELESRDISFNEKDGIRKLSSLLKDCIEKNAKKGENGGKTSITHFKPKAATYFDYYPDETFENDGNIGNNHRNDHNSEEVVNEIEGGEMANSNDVCMTVTISKLRSKDHYNTVLLELQRRGVTIPQHEAHKFNVKKLLRADEKARMKNEKLPLTFEPLFTPFTEYSAAISQENTRK